MEQGTERYEEFYSKLNYCNLIYYNYRHTDGELFSCVKRTLEICRAKRDEWIKTKEG